MTWHTLFAGPDEHQRLLGTIRRTGGVITHCCPCPAGYLVTYTTPGS